MKPEITVLNLEIPIQSPDLADEEPTGLAKIRKLAGHGLQISPQRALKCLGSQARDTTEPSHICKTLVLPSA